MMGGDQTLMPATPGPEAGHKCPRCGAESAARKGYLLVIAGMSLVWYGIYLLVFVAPLPGLVSLLLGILFLLRVAAPAGRRVRCRKCGYTWTPPPPGNGGTV